MSGPASLGFSPQVPSVEQELTEGELSWEFIRYFHPGMRALGLAKGFMFILVLLVGRYQGLPTKSRRLWGWRVAPLTMVAS